MKVRAASASLPTSLRFGSAANGGFGPSVTWNTRMSFDSHEVWPSIM